MVIKAIFSTFALALLSASAHCQEVVRRQSPWSFAVGAGSETSWQTGGFALPTRFVERPGIFSAATGYGVAGFMRVDRSWGKARLSLSSWVGATPQSFGSEQTTFIIRNEQIVPVTVEHSLEGTLYSAAISAGVGYDVVPGMTAYGSIGGIVSGGLRAEQWEAMEQPYRFSDGSARRLLASEQLFGSSFLPVASVSLVGRVPLAPLSAGLAGLSLAPQISVDYCFGSSPGADLSLSGRSALRLGLGLEYRGEEVFTIEYDTVRVFDTTVVLSAEGRSDSLRLAGVDTAEVSARVDDYTTRKTLIVTQRWELRKAEFPYLLTGAIATRFLDAKGKETSVAQVKMEEFVLNRHVPLLPMIFFDSASVEVPGRYSAAGVSEVGRLRSDSLSLPVYRAILSIVAERLKRYQDAKLTLEGSTGRQSGDGRDTSLGYDRARAVRALLGSAYGIDESAVEIRGRELPRKPSNTALREGRQENRRVDIVCNLPEVMAPVTIRDTLRVVDPPTIRFLLEGIAEAGMASWHVDISQSGAPLKSLSGTGLLPEYVDWPIQNDGIRPAASTPLVYTLVLRDSSGQEFRTEPAEILFEQVTIRKKMADRLADKVIDNYSLILFDYNSAAITAEQKKSLETIASTLLPSSRVTVVGLTDRTGTTQYNMQLAQQRADAVASLLGFQATFITTPGDDSERISNDTPEGRFYSRTVQIIVETMIRGR